VPYGFSRGSIWLDVQVGSMNVSHYDVDERFAREAAVRFLLQHVNAMGSLLLCIDWRILQQVHSKTTWHLKDDLQVGQVR
jgi:hypothetical protein